jgi:hypothetical protein
LEWKDGEEVMRRERERGREGGGVSCRGLALCIVREEGRREDLLLIRTE